MPAKKAPPVASCRHGVQAGQCYMCNGGKPAEPFAVSPPAPRRPKWNHGLPPAWLLVLRAAADLGERFSRTALILAVWQADKERFGLAGCEQYHPDANKVWVPCCGDRGLLGRKLMVKVGTDCYALTVEGRRVAREGR
mgnify:CR=1 FL=1